MSKSYIRCLNKQHQPQIMKRIFLLSLTLVCSLNFLFGQQAERIALDYLSETAAEYNINASDLKDYRITDQYVSKHTGVTHVWLVQTINGIDVIGTHTNVNILKTGKVLNVGSALISDLQSKIESSSQSFSANAAVKAAMQDVDMSIVGVQAKTTSRGAAQETSFEGGADALNDARARLVYRLSADESSIRLVWEVKLDAGKHAYISYVDAANGQIVYKRDRVIHCQFDHGNGQGSCSGNHGTARDLTQLQTQNSAANSYRVFAIPVESPNHGSRSLVLDPSDPVASPFGWHDTNGAAGPEFTITRGNNVHAYLDVNDTNTSAGDEPDGGANLDFDFPYNPGAQPSASSDAAVVNLFYMSNIMHDVYYRYGFDEASGNFQQNNYGNGGQGGDYVESQAQDGGGTNNANFFTPDDGQNPRMQMYLWTGGSSVQNLMNVNSPATVAGPYSSLEGTFGPGLPATPITGNLVLVDDGTANPNEGCNALINGAAINGNIALVDRGNCNFTLKVKNAQDEGAVAVVVCNNVAGGPIQMGGTDNTITIPSIMIDQADCANIKVALGSGAVNVTLQQGAGNVDKDGDYDNGIIAHEYGHGVSNRLTGGPSNSNCLGNDEQMGEGWSDWLGLMLTIEPGDAGTDIRGVGTYAVGQSTTGIGIRPAAYSTDFAVNGFTYGDSNDAANVSQPHGVGFVFATVLWDLTWALIDTYGYDPDLYNGTGGNNLAMQLVLDGMKLQPCNPGMIDGRDAIIAADQAFTGGQNRCLIWEVFANRGFGFSATQGSSNSRTDQVEAFDLPSFCQNPTVAPTADFSVNVTTSCSGSFNFTDESTNIPQTWLWNFGDGNTSTLQNPSHTYAASGTYTVTLTASNTIGSDVETKTSYVTVALPAAPTTTSATICANDNATLNASGAGTINWFDAANNQVGTGSTFTTGPVGATSTFFAQSEIVQPSQNVGPANNSFGTGAYHGTTFTGTVEFDAFVPFTLVSVFVDADGAGNRDISLFDATGATLQTVTVNIPNGTSRVTLNIDVPSPGSYSVGGTGVDLFRNDSGANYPYDLGGILTMTGSPAGPDFYYYLYDWEVREASCFSALEPALVTVAATPTANFSSTNVGSDYTFTDLSTGATSWAWDFGDGNTSTMQNPIHTYTAAGTYTVTLTVDNGTCTNVFTQTVSVAVSIEDVQGLNELSLVPTFGSGTALFTLDLQTKQSVRLDIMDATGRLISTNNYGEVNQVNEQLQFTGAAGIYFIRLTIGEATVIKRYTLMP